MHKLLERQLQKYYGDVSNLSPEQLNLLEVISRTYSDFDREYALIERSLNISSKELQELNTNLRTEVDAARSRTDELEKFTSLVIDRELQMVELKRQIEVLRRKGEKPS